MGPQAAHRVPVRTSQSDKAAEWVAQSANQESKTIHVRSSLIGCIGRGMPMGPCTTHPFTLGLVWLLGPATLMLLLSTPIPSGEGWALRVR